MQYPERILIVLHSDGTLKGAHLEMLEVDAEGKAIRQLPAQPLPRDTLAAVLPDVSLLLAQVAAHEDLSQKLATAVADIANKQTELDAANARIADLESASG